MEADQKERRKAGKLEKDVERDDVVGEHHPDHRGHEGHEAGVEAARLLIAAEISRRINQDERADYRHDERKENAQPIDHERQINVEPRHPWKNLTDVITLGDLPEEARKVHGHCRRHGSQDPASVLTNETVYQWRAYGGQVAEKNGD